MAHNEMPSTRAKFVCPVAVQNGKCTVKAKGKYAECDKCPNNK